MSCVACGAENPAAARFCTGCGARLAVICADCGRVAEPGARFCGECGASLSGGPRAAEPIGPTGPPLARLATAVPAAVVAERRLVSVLFADLVGFTSFAQERDAEDVRETLTRYFDLAREVMGRYGGTVEKFIGDAVMAVWGTPVSREDDAERAVRAGLELVDAVPALGPGIRARCGVLTGEAAVTLGASGQGMVAGDLVNTASRLQSIAAAGQVIVGEATMRAASLAIAFELAGEHALKGKPVPIPAWRALRVIAERGGRGRSDLPEPPFVGRAEELRTLKDLVAASGRDPRVRLVSITGPAGIGKSRLARELEKWVDGLVEDIWWHRGRSPAYGEGISFWALGEMVRRRAGLRESDDEATTRERLAATVAETVRDPAERDWIERALLTLLGLEPAPPGGRDVLFGAWRRFFERIATRGTTVLLFEDLQWADSGLLDFIDQVLEWTRGVPLLVITLARPELFDRRPDWGSATRNLTSMALGPLSTTEMRTLLDGFVPGLPDQAIEGILARAEGMPLYAVETVRALVADGRLEPADGAYRPLGDLGELTIPDSLRSLIASRLDTLDESDRALLQDASVLGQAFSTAALAAVSGRDVAEVDHRLRLLVRRELLEMDADPRSPERGQYRFIQALIREVAYGTLARRDRRSRHLAAARYLEALDDEEIAGALAMHYLAAFESSAAGPEADALGVQARLALRAAAERAATLGAHEQAVVHLQQALEVTTEPLEQAEILGRAATSAAVAARSELAESLARSACEAAARAGDPAAASRSSAVLGAVLLDASEPGRAIEVLEQAVEAVPPGDDAVRARLLANLARALYRMERPERAIGVADAALATAERLDLDDVLADALNNKASALSYIGRQREGCALMQLAVDIARDRGLVAAELRARSNLSSILWHRDPLTAAAMQRTNLELARRVGNRQMAHWIVGFVAWAGWLQAGGWEETLAEISELRPYAATAGDQGQLAWASGWLLAHRGDPCEEDLATLRRVADHLSDPNAAMQLAAIEGAVALSSGDHEVACREFTVAAESVGNQSDSLALAVDAALWLRDPGRARMLTDRLDRCPEAPSVATRHARTAARAGIAALEGRAADALVGYREALRGLDAIGYAFPRAKAALAWAMLLPDEPEARRAAGETRAIFERVGATPWLARLDEVLRMTAAPMPRADAAAQGVVTAGDA